MLPSNAPSIPVYTGAHTPLFSGAPIPLSSGDPIPLSTRAVATTRKLGILFLLCLSLLGVPLQAQEQHPSVYLEEELEELSAGGEEEGWEDELESLEWLRQHPIEVNSATRSEWEQLPFLDEYQVSDILDYLAQYGAMKSLNELYVVKGLSRQLVGRILPYLCIREAKEQVHLPTLKELLRWGQHRLESRLDIPLYRREGYRKSYLGPPLYHSLRYRYRFSNHIQLGLTAEKDAGEPLFAGYNSRGYDSYSPYLLIRDYGWLRQLALGHYRLHLGLGLCVGSGFLNGKSYSLTTANFRNAPITPHGSTDEYRFFRGTALQLEPLHRLQLLAFYSHRSLEGSLSGDTVTSIYKTGLHRTQKEADKRNAFSRQDMGGDLTYSFPFFQLGVAGIYTCFSRPYVHRLPKYARYYPTGSDFYNLSLHYKARWRSLFFSGESALGKKGYALLHRLDYRISNDARLLLVHRLYSHDYWSWHGYAFGESSTPQNENGWYLAAEATPWAHWRLFGSIDLFSHPWWKYRISKPSTGLDARLQAQWSPRSPLQLTLSYQYKQKERDLSGTSGKDIRPLYHHRTRLRMEYTRPLWQSQTTLDYNHLHQTHLSPSQGWSITERIRIAPRRFPLALTLQGSYFHTSDYDSRIYAYERGMLNSFSTPSFYGEGIRLTLHLRYDHRWLTLLAKWGETRYFDRQTIGTGNDLIRQKHKDDLYLQAIITF